MYKDERIIGIEKNLASISYGITNILILTAICFRTFILNQSIIQYVDLVIIYTVAVSFLYLGILKNKALVKKHKKFDYRKLIVKESVILLGYYLFFVYILGLKINLKLALILLMLSSIRLSIQVFLVLFSKKIDAEFDLS